MIHRNANISHLFSCNSSRKFPSNRVSPIFYSPSRLLLFLRSFVNKPIKHYIMNSVTNEQVVCLNPKCKQVLSSCMAAVEHGRVKNSPREHQKCEGWLQVIRKMQGKGQSLLSNGQEPTLDLFRRPLQSMEWLESFSMGPWRQQMSDYFTQVQSRLETMLSRVYQACVQKIQLFLAANSTLQSNISFLCQRLDEPSFSPLAFYNQHLRIGLMQTSEVGVLRIVNQVCMQRQIGAVEAEIALLSQQIWQEQDKYCLEKRRSSNKNEEELASLGEESDSMIVNNYLTSIHGALRLKPFKYEEEIGIRCRLCKWKEKGVGPRKQIKEGNARIELLRHLCHRHSSQVIEGYLGPRNKITLEVNFEQVMKNIREHQYRTLILIDRQNIKQSCALNNQPNQGVYVLEVVSEHSQTLPQGRYIVARSRARDAADTLIILLLYEIAKKTDLNAVLITRDHFGPTLQAILKQIDLKVQISKQYSAGSASLSNITLSNLSFNSGLSSQPLPNHLDQ